jgi:hypothetical protein
MNIFYLVRRITLESAPNLLEDFEPGGAAEDTQRSIERF